MLFACHQVLRTAFRQRPQCLSPPEVYLYTFIFSAMGYGSVVFVLLLIKTSGSTNAEIVKSCRKVFTIVLSFLLYAKPVAPLHWVGGAVFIGSVLISMKLKMDKKKKPSRPTDGPAYAAVQVGDVEAVVSKPNQLV